MDIWGNITRRQIGQSTSLTNTRNRGGIVMKPIVVTLEDPLENHVTVRDKLQAAAGGVRPPSIWASIQRGQHGQVGRTGHGAPTWEGRVCCFAHLTQYDGRADLKLPFQTNCPGCGARYEIRLGLVRR